MNTFDQNPYSGLTPEELQIAIRRAHAERAKAMRELFAALLAWLRKAPERDPARKPALRTAVGH